MAGRNDLDWLYGRDHAGAPDATRAFGSAPESSPAPPQGATPGDVPPPDPYVRPAPAPRAAAPESLPQPPRFPDHTPQASPERTPQHTPRTPLTRRQRRRRARRITGGVLALLLCYLLVLPATAWFGSARIDATAGGDRPGFQPGITLLLTGSDSRDGLTDAERKKLGTGSVDGQRTDTIMLLHVPVLGKPALVSLPRDSYVSIPGHGKNKINAAYALGGAPLLAETVEQNTGVRIDGYAELGFGGFVNIIDSVGGIPMCLDAPMKDKDAHVDLEAGCQTLTGTEALGYVRMRKSDPKGDIGRAERQRDMVSATVKKAASPLTVLNPVRWVSLNLAVRGAITRGRDTGPLDAAALLYGAGRIGTGSGYTLSVPVADTNYQTAAGSSVLWDDAQASVLWTALRTGNTRPLADLAQN